MQSWYVRCAHCGTEYLYSTRVKGAYSRFSQEYCPECSLLLEKALEGVSVRFEARWQEISIDDEMRIVLREARERARIVKMRSHGCGIEIEPYYVAPLGMTSGVVVETSFKRYALCVDGDDNEHLYLWDVKQLIK